MEASLYLHFPFCATKCDYCDFYSIRLPGRALVDAYIDALIRDLERQVRLYGLEEVPSIYIGGGTPSLLSLAQLQRLLSALKPLIKPGTEFSMELNPESVREDFLKAALDGGLNRASLGVETFHAPSREAVKRCGSLGRLYQALELCAASFPASLSLDLLSGLPYQDTRQALNDIAIALQYRPVHISLYSLILAEGTPLERNRTLPLPEDADEQWLAGRDALVSAGFQHYEVSNFSRSPQSQCRHNRRYWEMENWLALGAGASGTLIEGARGRRRTYPNDVEAYLRGAPAMEEELETPVLLREVLMMGFRLASGPVEARFRERFGCSIGDLLPKTLEKWQGRDKMLYHNALISDCFSELDAVLPS
jgi:oxygen-independent coproporphyrinogen-3 oxidase